MKEAKERKKGKMMSSSSSSSLAAFAVTSDDSCSSVNCCSSSSNEAFDYSSSPRVVCCKEYDTELLEETLESIERDLTTLKDQKLLLLYSDWKRSTGVEVFCENSNSWEWVGVGESNGTLFAKGVQRLIHHGLHETLFRIRFFPYEFEGPKQPPTMDYTCLSDSERVDMAIIQNWRGIQDRPYIKNSESPFEPGLYFLYM